MALPPVRFLAHRKNARHNLSELLLYRRYSGIEVV